MSRTAQMTITLDFELPEEHFQDAIEQIHDTVLSNGRFNSAIVAAVTKEVPEIAPDPDHVLVESIGVP